MTISTPHPPSPSLPITIATPLEISIPSPPTDPILTLHAAFLSDPRSDCINLSLGVYTCPSNGLYQFPVVKSVLSSLPAPSSHAYLPILGHPQLRQLAVPLIYGPSHPDVAIVHTVAGSGALRLAMAFCARILHCSTAYIAQPTWPNHEQVAQAEGLRVRRYRYFQRELDFDGMLCDLSNAPTGCVVILQACSHNPTGCDLNEQQWDKVEGLIRERGLIPVFDMAYQGLASGNLERDAYAVRKFAQSGVVLCAQSFSKNMGLYGSRVGTLSYVGKDLKQAEGQMAWIARGMYSSPPIEGARIVVEVLKRRREWEREIERIVRRVEKVREQVSNGLGRELRGKGLFVQLDLDVEKVKKEGIYVGGDGRVNLGGVHEGNLERVVNVLRQGLKD